MKTGEIKMNASKSALPSIRDAGNAAWSRIDPHGDYIAIAKEIAQIKLIELVRFFVAMAMLFVGALGVISIFVGSIYLFAAKGHSMDAIIQNAFVFIGAFGGAIAFGVAMNGVFKVVLR